MTRTLQERYIYALTRSEKIWDRYPDIAEIWLQEAELLKTKIDAEAKLQNLENSDPTISMG